jgi:hypothetical protein
MNAGPGMGNDHCQQWQHRHAVLQNPDFLLLLRIDDMFRSDV